MVSAIFLTFPVLCGAQVRSVGLMASPKSAGIETIFRSKSGVTSGVRVYFDLYGVLKGDFDKPGCAADYHVLYGIAEKDCRRCSLKLSAGPGALLGYGRDRKSGYGLNAGLSGIVMAEFSFGVPVSISLSLSGALGGHLVFDKETGGTLSSYKNGIYRCCIPELTLRYVF